VVSSVPPADTAPPANPVVRAPPPAPPAVPLPRKVVLTTDTHFAAANATLDSPGRAHLAGFVAGARHLAADVVLVIGHADGTERPTEAAARALSQARAEAVKAQLVALGLDASRIYAEGVGHAQPRANQASPERRSRNRRVEIEYTGTQAGTAPAD